MLCLLRVCLSVMLLMACVIVRCGVCVSVCSSHLLLIMSSVLSFHVNVCLSVYLWVTCWYKSISKQAHPREPACSIVTTLLSRIQILTCCERQELKSLPRRDVNYQKKSIFFLPFVCCMRAKEKSAVSTAKLRLLNASLRRCQAMKC